MTIYVVTRYVHSVTFALRLQPFRTISFLIGFVCTVRSRGHRVATRSDSRA
jgi:hypothetical protein